MGAGPGVSRVEGAVTVVDDRRVRLRVTHTQGLSVAIEQPSVRVPLGRRHVQVHVIDGPSLQLRGRLCTETHPQHTEQAPCQRVVFGAANGEPSWV